MHCTSPIHPHLLTPQMQELVARIELHLTLVTCLTDNTRFKVDAAGAEGIGRSLIPFHLIPPPPTPPYMISRPHLLGSLSIGFSSVYADPFKCLIVIENVPILPSRARSTSVVFSSEVIWDDERREPRKG